MEKFFYRVQAGDCIYSISERFNVPLFTIVKLNRLKKEVCAGDLLYIESGEKRIYKVKPFENADFVAKKFNLDRQKLLNDNGVSYLFYGLTLLIDG